MNLQVRFISKRTVQAIILLNSTKCIMSGEDAVQGTDPLVLMGQFYSATDVSIFYSPVF